MAVAVSKSDSVEFDEWVSNGMLRPLNDRTEAYNYLEANSKRSFAIYKSSTFGPSVNVMYLNDEGNEYKKDPFALFIMDGNFMVADARNTVGQRQDLDFSNKLLIESLRGRCAAIVSAKEKLRVSSDALASTDAEPADASGAEPNAVSKLLATLDSLVGRDGYTLTPLFEALLNDDEVKFKDILTKSKAFGFYTYQDGVTITRKDSPNYKKAYDIAHNSITPLTPFRAAVELERPKFAALLLAKGGGDEVPEPEYLIDCVKAGKVRQVKILSDLGITGFNVWTGQNPAIDCAVKSGQHEILAILLASGNSGDGRLEFKCPSLSSMNSAVRFILQDTAAMPNGLEENQIARLQAAFLLKMDKQGGGPLAQVLPLLSNKSEAEARAREKGVGFALYHSSVGPGAIGFMYVDVAGNLQRFVLASYKDKEGRLSVNSADPKSAAELISEGYTIQSLSSDFRELRETFLVNYCLSVVPGLKQRGELDVALAAMSVLEPPSGSGGVVGVFHGRLADASTDATSSPGAP